MKHDPGDPMEVKLDDWLDRALAGYSRAEPRPGLEARVLANLAQNAGRSLWWRRPRMAWVSAAAVAFVLLLAIMIVRREKPYVPSPAGTDRDLLLGVDRLLSREVPSALEPALVLTKEISKNE